VNRKVLNIEANMNKQYICFQMHFIEKRVDLSVIQSLGTEFFRSNTWIRLL